MLSDQFHKKCHLAEEAVRVTIHLIAQIDGKNHPPEVQDACANAMTELYALVSDGLRTATIGEMTAALKPLGASLLALGEDLTGSAGRAAAAAARHDDDCRRALCHVFINYGASFVAWYDIFNILHLFEVKAGEIENGVFLALCAPLSVSIAALPALLDALGGTDSGYLSKNPQSAEIYAKMVGAVSYFMRIAFEAPAAMGKSYYLPEPYLSEMYRLRRNGSFLNADLDGTVLKWATAGVQAVLKADAWPELQSYRNEMHVPETCSLYIYFIGHFTSSLRENQGGVPQNGLLPIQVVIGRLRRLLSRKGFVSAFSAAMERACAKQRTYSNGTSVDILAKTGFGANEFISSFMAFRMLSSLNLWPPECQGNKKALFNRQTWKTLVSGSQQLLQAVAAAETAMDPSDRHEAICAAIFGPLLTLNLVVVKGRIEFENPAGKLELRDAMTALGAFAHAWNFDSDVLQPSGFGSRLVDSAAMALDKLEEDDFFVMAAAMPSAGPPDAWLNAFDTAVTAVDDLACMAGSIFVALEGHTSPEHAKHKGLAVRLAATLPKVLIWAADAVTLIGDRCWTVRGVDKRKLKAIAPKLLQATHSCLTAARAYVTAPWTTWIAAFESRLFSDQLFKALPSLVLVAAATMGTSLQQLLEDGLDHGLPAETLAGLALDVFATVQDLVRAYQAALMIPKTGIDESFHRGVERVLVTTGFLVNLVGIIDDKVGLAGYFTGPDPGAQLLLAVEESRAMRRFMVMPDEHDYLPTLRKRVEQMQGATASERAQKKRAGALATLPCSNLFCRRVRRPGEAKIPRMKCSGCKKLSLCSVECQRKAWKEQGHKSVCALLSATQ